MTLLKSYADRGIHAKCIYTPRGRGAFMVSEGQLDGSILRGKEFGLNFPDLIRVEPAVMEMTFVVYHRKGSDTTLENWRQRSIATLLGAMAIDKYLVGLDVTRVSTIEAALKLLSSGRVDVVLGDLLLVPHVIESVGIENLEPLYPPVASELMYHYLHPKNQALANKMSAILLVGPKNHRI